MLRVLVDQIWLNVSSMLLQSRKSKKEALIIGSHMESISWSLFGKKIFDYEFKRSDLRIPLEALDTHVHVVGKTKKGKTGFLLGLAWQLVKLGQGVCLLDPHGDAANDLLRLLAFYRERPGGKTWLEKPGNADKLIYCHPGRSDWFIPMNILASNDAPHIIASNIIDAMQRTWKKELETAPQFLNITEHAIHLFVEHGLSLVELSTLITDNDFRNHLVERCQNEDVVDYFKGRFEAWGHREQVLRSESLLNKVTRLTLNPNLKVMLGSDSDRLNFRQLMDTQSVVIISFGYPCDRDTKNLLGSIILARILQAAFSRGEIPQEKRHPFFTIADEVQKWLNEGGADTVEEILSETRKFGHYLIVAHQGFHQLGSNETKGAMEQAQLKVVLGSGETTASAIAGDMHVPDYDRVKHEAPTERTHPHYESLLEQEDKFKKSVLGLKHREMLVQLPDTREPVRLKTVTLPAVNASIKQLEAIKSKLLRSKGTRVKDGLEQIKNRRALFKQTGLRSGPLAGNVIQNPSVNR